MNPEFDTIGKTFVQAYYARFDQKHTRSEVVQFYIVSNILDPLPVLIHLVILM